MSAVITSVYRNSPGIGLILLAMLHVVLAYTHWVITDQGRIRSKIYSEFHLRRPENLIIFIRTEDDLKRLKRVKEELSKEKKVLEVERDEEKVDLVMKYHSEDEDCLLAGKPLKNFDLKISTVIPFDTLGIRYTDYIDFKSELPHQSVPPFCAAVLPFSMITMEHLEGLVKRDQINNYSEKDLNKHIFAEYQLENIGHRIKYSLEKNETSWILLNLAALYWRIQGNSFEAIECLRRALYYSYSNARGMTLVSLANILHHTGFSKDASVVVDASLHFLNDKRISWFTLGNIFASLGRYSSSEICFREALEIQPNFNTAKHRLHAVLCERKLQKALEQQHE
ncbi:tetratricopeptide repeat 17-like isoform X2 [Paramuricea clavata]|uniref:Tetratricopeptide repeat 17-like isoform X2 n=1 Tax=Paramuricea clavata TaxID=317549 RepID=A0A7D9ENG0_PARCT|nr:tetratricopeptide repeat 17-like isoform X2 [Paramuricea clavata]